MKKWILHTLIAVLFTGLMPDRVAANGIVVSNVRMTSRDTSAGLNNAANHTFIRFNISWQNSWRMQYATGINNRDAAWVFVKYKIDGTNEWKTAWLSNTGHLPGTWNGFSGAGPMQFEPGLRNPDSAYHATANPALGVFMYGNGFYMGSAGADSIQLRWNYGAQGIPDSAIVEMRVFAIEMAYVPTVGFWVGTGGTEDGSFTDGSWASGATIPFRITNEAALNIGNNPGELWGISSAGDSTIGGQEPWMLAFQRDTVGFTSKSMRLRKANGLAFSIP